jgi:hypothetical protein
MTIGNNIIANNGFKKLAVKLSASTFVVKIPPIAPQKNVIARFKRKTEQLKTNNYENSN